MDFSNWTARCSSLGYIMSEATGKSYSDLYIDACGKLNETKQKIVKYGAEWNEYKNKETKQASAKMEQILKQEEKRDALKIECERLYSLKDKIILSETCKTHLIDVWIGLRWGKDFSYKNKSKYIQKGLLLEEDAITDYSVLTQTMFRKNTERRNNGIIQGEYDIDVDDIVHDTKVSWDTQTFFRTLGKPLSRQYWWQLQGYMWLFGFKKAKLVYSLVPTPEHLIMKQEREIGYSFVGTKEELDAAIKNMRDSHDISVIPEDFRAIEFEVEVDEDCRERVESVVKECRIFLNELENNKHILHNKLKIAA